MTLLGRGTPRRGGIDALAPLAAPSPGPAAITVSATSRMMRRSRREARRS